MGGAVSVRCSQSNASVHRSAIRANSARNTLTPHLVWVQDDTEQDTVS